MMSLSSAIASSDLPAPLLFWSARRPDFTRPVIFLNALQEVSAVRQMSSSVVVVGPPLRQNEELEKLLSEQRRALLALLVVSGVLVFVVVRGGPGAALADVVAVLGPTTAPPGPAAGPPPGRPWWHYALYALTALVAIAALVLAWRARYHIAALALGPLPEDSPLMQRIHSTGLQVSYLPNTHKRAAGLGYDEVEFTRNMDIATSLLAQMNELEDKGGDTFGVVMLHENPIFMNAAEALASKKRQAAFEASKMQPQGDVPPQVRLSASLLLSAADRPNGKEWLKETVAKLQRYGRDEKVVLSPRERELGLLIDADVTNAARLLFLYGRGRLSASGADKGGGVVTPLVVDYDQDFKKSHAAVMRRLASELGRFDPEFMPGEGKGLFDAMLRVEEVVASLQRNPDGTLNTSGVVEKINATRVGLRMPPLSDREAHELRDMIGKWTGYIIGAREAMTLKTMETQIKKLARAGKISRAAGAITFGDLHSFTRYKLDVMRITELAHKGEHNAARMGRHVDEAELEGVLNEINLYVPRKPFFKQLYENFVTTADDWRRQGRKDEQL
jgi:hypothetical protein